MNKASDWAKHMYNRFTDITAKSQLVTPFPNASGKQPAPPAGLENPNSYSIATFTQRRLQKEYDELAALPAPTAAQIQRKQNLEKGLRNIEKNVKMSGTNKNQFKGLFPNAPPLNNNNNNSDSSGNNEGLYNTLMRGALMKQGGRRKQSKTRRSRRKQSKKTRSARK